MEEALKILHQISNCVDKKYSETFTIISDKSEIIQKFDVPIKLEQERNYQVSLCFFTVYNAIKNITKENNKFTYNIKNKRQAPTTIEIPEGSYEVKNLNTEIYRQTGLDNKKLELCAIQYLNRTCLKTSEDIEVIFGNSDQTINNIPRTSNIHKLLGFEPGTYSGYSVAQNIAQIEPIKTINIKTNLVYSGYMKNKKNNILYSIPTFTVPIGFKITEKPTHRISLPCAQDNISEMEFRIVDENDNLIDFSGETITLQILIEQV